MFKSLFKKDINALKDPDKPLFKIPKSTQDEIDILGIYDDGIFKVSDNKFSKCYRFTDINYSTMTNEEQRSILDIYCDFLNTLDCQVKITIGNKHKSLEKTKKELFFEYKNDGIDDYRKAYNDVFTSKLKEGKFGIEQERFLTLTVQRSTYEEAKSQFNILELNFQKSFELIHSDLTLMTTEERLQSLYSYWHLGKEDNFKFNLEKYKKTGRDFKNDLAVNGISWYQDYFTIGDKYCRGLFLMENLPTWLDDDLIRDISSLQLHCLISTDIIPIPKSLAAILIRDKYLSVEEDIRRQQQIRNKQYDFSSDISYAKKQEKEELEEIMDDVHENDDNLFFCSCTIVLMANSKEELDRETSEVELKAKEKSAVIQTNMYQQREAFKTALPVGQRMVKTTRTSLTQDVAALVPFNVMELRQEKGIFYGINQISKNPCICDRKRLMNGNGIITGVPGSGKSFSGTKMELGQVLLKYPNDDVIIIDPQNEYFDIVNKFSGDILNLSSRTDHHFNPLDIDMDNFNENTFQYVITEKTEFMLGLCEQMKENHKLTDEERAIITEAVFRVFKIAMKTREVPIMESFYKAIEGQRDEDAYLREHVVRLGLMLRPFVSGAFSIFNHQSNINMNNRLLCFGLNDLSSELWAPSIIIILESIQKRIKENITKGKATWIYIDEFHLLLTTDYSSQYIKQYWKKDRKRGAIYTGITQNIIDLSRTVDGETILNNSEFLMCFKQSQKDIEAVADATGISLAQLKYVDNSARGKGIIKWKNQVVPIDLVISKDNLLYKMYNTDYHEKNGTI